MFQSILNLSNCQKLGRFKELQLWCDMGNAQIKPHPRVRNKKQVHWKAADRPAPPGKPELLPESEGTPDLVTLRWARPVNDGGSPVSGYLVEHRRVGSPHWVRATPLPVPFPEITLSGLEPGWRYQFRVSAENAVGYSDPSEISEQITVTFQRSAVTAPKFTQEVNDTVALENDKCEFVVHFLGQPPPKVCWFKDGFEIFSSRRIRILTEHDRSILTIHQTSLSDEGEIKCTATNRAGHVTTKARLTVEAPPSIRLPRNYEDGLLFEIGEIIRLKVSVVGRPTPLVFWSHNGESIQDNDRYEVDYTDKSVSLKIAEAKREDRGEYQIKAVNKLGEDNASFLVTVTDKPSPPEISVPGKARVVMALGRSVTLSWTSPKDDGGCKIGNYIIEYYRLGWNVWLKAATSRQLTTRLGDLIEGSEYKFRIKAESPYGVSDPSEESDIVFIPDPKRGITHPSSRGRSEQRDVLGDTNKSKINAKHHKPRSQSSSRVELPSKVLNNTSDTPPVRPKRTKSKSQQHTPESTPVAQRKRTDYQINKTIFDRESLTRDLAYGSPDLAVKKNLVPHSKESNVSYYSDQSSSSPKTPSPEIVHKTNTNSGTITKDETRNLDSQLQVKQKVSRPEETKKLVREHSATLTGSSEFMLVLYSEDNEKENTLFNFDENSIPPPLSLSAPELSDMDQFSLPPLKNSASSSELLHERAMMRFYLAAEAEERELEKLRKDNSEKRASLDIPKIQINSKDSDRNSGRRHSLRRKISNGSLSQQQVKWNNRRHSLKNTAELTKEGIPSILKKVSGATDMKRDLMNDVEDSTSDMSSSKQKEILSEKPYTQTSFERKPVTFTEEMKWKEEYEESLSESDTDSESDYGRFRHSVDRNRHVHNNQTFDDEDFDTYRPVGGPLIGNAQNEPFEILNKPKSLPDPNFIPKPILKKVDSPSFTPNSSPNISPVISPPLSPTKTARALSPRPDIILQRNRSKSLAVPTLSTLISNSSGEESDEPKKPRSRSASITLESLLPERKESSKIVTSPIFSSIATVAQITGITAASIVIPEKLLERKKDEEASKVVADHYDAIVKSIGERRRSNPMIRSDKPVTKVALDSLNTSLEDNLSNKDKTPSKENLSQDSGYQSLSGYRRGSFTDHYDTISSNKSLQKQLDDKSLETPDTKPISQQHISSQNLVNTKIPDKTQKKHISTKETETPFRSEEKQNVVQKNVSNKSKIKESLYGIADNSKFRNLKMEIHQPRRSSPSPKGRRSVARSTSPSKRGASVTRRSVGVSPLQQDNRRKLKPAEKLEDPNKTLPSIVTQNRNINSRSPSPIARPKRNPKLKEIMTQTSGYLESFSADVSSQKARQYELLAHAEVKVRTTIDWLTDLAMFAVACWLYFFKNELLAIPVLLILVYRQLKEEIKKRIPEWVAKRFRKTN